MDSDDEEYVVYLSPENPLVPDVPDVPLVPEYKVPISPQEYEPVWSLRT
jgi:hypothetical protein